jgi:outer membrane protein insertion porin family
MKAVCPFAVPFRASMNYCSRFLPCLLCLTLIVHVAAQQAHSDRDRGAQSLPGTTPATEQMLGSYEGQNVASIDIAGRPDLSTAQFELIFAQKAGQPFSKQKVMDTVAALKMQGHLKKIRLEVDPDPHGVRVLLILEPAVYFGIYRFPGASVFPYSQLLQVANYPVQTPYSAPEVERDRLALLKFYRQQGYFQAEVKTELKVDTVHDIANVAFNSTLGRKSKFGEVVISGLPSDKDTQLENSLKGFGARLHEAAIRPGKRYHYSTMTRATTYLQGKLEKRNLLRRPGPAGRSRISRKHEPR